jgi:hypothetical protein
MAKRFLTPLNLSNLASDPATGSEGDLYFNTTNDVVKIYINGAWTELQGGGGGGSVIYTANQPDVTGLEVGTIWVDSDATISSGGGGGGTGGPSFQTIVTSPVSASIVAQTSGEILTLISGENISIVNASANNSVTINSTGNYSSVNSISTPDYIQFDTTANTNPVTGLMGWDSVEGTLNLGLSSGKHIHLGEESVFRVRNSTGSTIGKGTALYASGVEPSGRIQVTPYVANGSVREVRFMGLATESISSGVNGFVQHFGYVRDLDTRGTSSTSISVGDETWAAGDLLYVHPTVPGKLTNVKPQHEIVVAIIIIRHESTGILFVRPTSGGHLEDIHDISLSSLSNEDILIYNSASSIWVNSPKQNIINTASAAAVSYLVDGAPEALNTLNELSEALNDNADILDTLLTTTAASSTYLPLSASASFYRWTKTYSASASVISGVDDNSISLSYNAGYIQLFINGVMLDPSEYTATSGSAITVSTPVLSGEVVDIFAFRNSTSVNTYSQAQIDAKYNNLTRWKKAYSASATVISGVDDNSNTLSYLSGYEQFYLNGILLTPITDYARTDSSIVTLSTPLISGDIVEIINTQPFNVADTYTTSQVNNTFLTQASASSTYLNKDSGYYYKQTLYYTSSGTFSKSTYPWLRAIKVRMVGGGGGGSDAQTTGGSQVSIGGAGGGGGYCEKFYTDISSLSASVTVTVGNGGTPTNSGASSTFIGMTAGGGAPGQAMGAGTIAFYYSNPGSGGAASGGDLNINGGSGISGNAWAYDRIQNSVGGSTLLSGINAQSVATTKQNGANGSSYGGGGNGATNSQNQTATAGGTGAAGIVILELFA